MSRYWSCSKFADKLRGTPKPKWLELGEWETWEEQARKAHPIRYWLAEEGLDYISDTIDFIPDKLYAIKYYINNRWVTKTNALTAHPSDIRPGDWRDVGDRFLPCLFNEVVDFVEIELAWWHIVWDKEAAKKYSAPWYSRGWFRWRTWRNAECGIDNLKWQSSLRYGDDDGVDEKHKLFGKFTPQAERAQELLALYDWWKNQRPTRPDPYEASGWREFHDRMEKQYGGSLSNRLKFTKEEKKESTKVSNALHKLEEEWEKEDEDMMIRLIKVRHALWT